jgi:hypothetical protein
VIIALPIPPAANPMTEGTMSMSFIPGLGCKSRLSRRATEILGSHIALETMAAAIMESLRAFIVVVILWFPGVVSVVLNLVLMEMVITIVPARLTACSTSDIRNYYVRTESGKD